jgi:hypothetical protein
MLYFTTRMQCPMCSCKFRVWFGAESPPDPGARYLVYCPENASPFVLPFSLFRAVKKQPKEGVEAKPAGDQPVTYTRADQHAPPRWWQFWKW